MSCPRPSRAAASATRVEAEALSLMCPSKLSGSPIICSSHRQTTHSSSVAAGEVRQSMALTLIPAVSISPKIPAADPELVKYAKKRGWAQ